MIGNGKHTNYGDDWGMVYDCYTHIPSNSNALSMNIHDVPSGKNAMYRYALFSDKTM